jgi:predicted AlkP superfamily phosphohydrolase/phosphomutase
LTTRTLFIGLDGATFTVLDTLTGSDPRRGIVMPNLRRIMEHGARGFLRSTINPLTPPAWVSLMTGRSPGAHGVYDFLRAEERDEDVFFTLTDARDVQVETIWSVASRNDRTIVALNFPITAPPRPVNGFMVPGFVPWKHLRRNVTPPELFDRLKALPGFDAKELAWDFDREVQAMHELDKGGVEEWLGYHADREGQWFRIAEALLRDEEPDLMAVMFDGTDKIQHQAWKYLAPEYDWSNPAPGEEKIVALCRRYFAELDDFIGQLVRQAGPEAQVFFASDHGFTGSTEVVRMNQILHELGYLGWRPHDGSVASERRSKSWFADLDWSKTLAYCPTPSSNGITIRVAERPGASGIAPHEYEEFRDRLRHELLEYKAPDGGKVVRQVHKREEAFSGPATDMAPDLLFGLRDYGFASIANQQPAIMPRSEVAGTHHPDGIFIAFGPGIAAGTQVEGAKIEDVAATLLYSTGVAIPADFEGRVVEQAMTANQLRATPVRVGPNTIDVRQPADQSAEMPADEKEKILEQLKMLGYMD